MSHGEEEQESTTHTLEPLPPQPRDRAPPPPLTRSVTLIQSILSLHHDTATCTNNNDHTLIQQTREYRDFVRALERLELVYHHSTSLRNDATDDNSNGNHSDHSNPIVPVDASILQGRTKSNGILSFVSFLQYVATDDIILRCFSYLECYSLCNVMLTCTRLHTLTNQHAIQRTRPMAGRRQLTTPMQLLKAYEQIMIGEAACYSGSEQSTKCSNIVLPIPTLLLPKRIRVRDCGDTEYNGIYYCTGCNGNGYVFTKPRYPIQKRVINQSSQHIDLATNLLQTGIHNVAEYDVAECNGAEARQPLRCIIAKRFSDEVRVCCNAVHIRFSCTLNYRSSQMNS
jgi:hypothetical protein